jgi:hypothetical protein
MMPGTHPHSHGHNTNKQQSGEKNNIRNEKKNVDGKIKTRKTAPFVIIHELECKAKVRLFALSQLRILAHILSDNKDCLKVDRFGYLVNLVRNAVT